MPPPPRPPIHLKPAAELADRVLLPGDPQRAHAMAQALLVGPRMFNHKRGLWGYTGEAPDGQALTIQATGMGGPSAAIVVQELLDLGARALVRIGTCGALVAELRLGDLLVVEAVLPADGASVALGANERVAPDARLTDALLASGRDVPASPAAGTVVSTDLFYDSRPELADRWVGAGAVAAEMEAATVLQLASRTGAAAGCLLAVSDLLEPRTAGAAREGRRIAPEALDALGIRMGEIAFGALSAVGSAARTR